MDSAAADADTNATSKGASSGSALAESGAERPDLTIPLTTHEQRIFSVLNSACARAFGERRVVLRVAGGWVRDKLLGTPSHDIDIAVDCMSGAEFAQAVRAFVDEQNDEPGAKETKVAVIRSNPEQSKHLETATMNVLGLPIDFVNLRAEEYTHASRIPAIRIGTPEEDAYRRDLTINALFYNISTRMIEDFTGMGVKDLHDHIVRTPLAPLETFLDDPLRVLRSIRFAARLGFSCVPELLEAAAAPTVRDALHSKISRERIGKELSLMLCGARFGMAAELLHKVGLWGAVFKLPPTLCATDGDALDGLAGGEAAAVPWEGDQSVRVVKLLAARSELPEPLSEEETTARKCTLLAGLLYPLREREYITKKRKRDRVTCFVVLDSLKLSLREAQGAALVQDVAAEFAAIMREALGAGTRAAMGDVLSRARLGMLLRKAGPTWMCGLALAACVLEEEGVPAESANNALEDVVRLHRETYKLGNAWELKPLGLELAALLKKKAGPWVQRALEQEFVWMFEHPGATRDACVEWAQQAIEPV